MIPATIKPPHAVVMVVATRLKLSAVLGSPHRRPSMFKKSTAVSLSAVLAVKHQALLYLAGHSSDGVVHPSLIIHCTNSSSHLILSSHSGCELVCSPDGEASSAVVSSRILQ